jgi:predicted Zn-dependent protease
MVVLMSACATVPPVPKADLPVLIDPRLGFDGPSSDPVDRKFAAAWQKLAAGEVEAADKTFAALATKYPRYSPVVLGRAVVALAKGQVDVAERYLEKVADPGSSYFAAEAYRAEIALKRELTEDAYRNYERISQLPGAPTIVTTRREVVADAWFEELLARAGATESATERIALLEEAVAVRPRADSTRVELARALVSAQEWTRARTQVNVLLDRGLVDNPDVQALIADLEVSEARYQDAIVRLERLASRYPGRGYEARLADVKMQYMRANLPPRYHRAVASEGVTRADLAVLAYWHVSAIRFASISEPPIAVDIAGEPARDEIVKSLGLGLMSVDPATRAFGPEVVVSPRGFAAFVTRLMRLGPPECAGGLSGAEALAACGIDLGSRLQNGTSVRGTSAIEILDAIDDLLSSPK